MSKTALVTGASSGIGRSTARILAKSGYNLVLCGRRKNRLEELADELSEAESKILSFDVSNLDEVKAAITGLEGKWSQIDVLINNAGNAHGQDKFQNGSLQDWDLMIDSNVKGLLYMSRLILPGMIKLKKGHIVNVGSIAGTEVYPGGNIYCATKAAVDFISKSMRLDLLGTGIKVSEIKPGLVETEFSEVRFKGDKEKAKNHYKGLRPLVAEDIAECIAFIVNAPDHVNVADMVVMPKDQANGNHIFRS